MGLEPFAFQLGIGAHAAQHLPRAGSGDPGGHLSAALGLVARSRSPAPSLVSQGRHDQRLKSLLERYGSLGRVEPLVERLLHD